MPLPVGYTWDGTSVISAGPPRIGASGLAQGGINPVVGQDLPVVQAVGVDAQQNLHAMPGPLSDPLRRDSGSQPQGHRGMTKVISATRQRGGDLDRC